MRGARPAIEVAVHVREPLLRTVMADGTFRWLDAEAVLLPASLEGPDYGRTADGHWLPRVRDIGGVDHAVLHDLVQSWPAIQRVIPEDLMVDIYCDAELDTAGQRGVVFVTKHGTRIIWGNPLMLTWASIARKKSKTFVALCLAMAI